MQVNFGFARRAGGGLYKLRGKFNDWHNGISFNELYVSH
jgi:hypothetical protein